MLLLFQGVGYLLQPPPAPSIAVTPPQQQAEEEGSGSSSSSSALNISKVNKGKGRAIVSDDDEITIERWNMKMNKLYQLFISLLHPSINLWYLTWSPRQLQSFSTHLKACLSAKTQWCWWQGELNWTITNSRLTPSSWIRS